MQNNNRYSKYVALVALFIAVVGVSLGFAAYSNTVQIKAAADYRGVPDPSQLPGQLSTDPDEQKDGEVTPTATGGATAEDADLDESGIENIKVHFTAPGQSATYSFYAVNPSAFVAYLNSVVFGSKTCAASNANGNPASDIYVNGDPNVPNDGGVCNDITMTIAIGSNDYTETDTDIDGVSMNAGANMPVTVTIDYISGGAVADGDFDVDFGTSTVTFGTVD